MLLSRSRIEDILNGHPRLYLALLTRASLIWITPRFLARNPNLKNLILKNCIDRLMIEFVGISVKQRVGHARRSVPVQRMRLT